MTIAFAFHVPFVYRPTYFKCNSNLLTIRCCNQQCLTSRNFFENFNLRHYYTTIITFIRMGFNIMWKIEFRRQSTQVLPTALLYTKVFAFDPLYWVFCCQNSLKSRITTKYFTLSDSFNSTSF